MGSGTLSPSANGNLLVIGAKQTVVTRDITLRGRDANNASVVTISREGIFHMEGNASVTGNKTSGNGGGVYVNKDVKFTMQDSALVAGNAASVQGGGVYVVDSDHRIGRGTFTMQDNTSVAGNTALSSGGVYVGSNGTFTKTGGIIYGDDADQNLKNTAISRLGNAVYEAQNSSWRNASAGPTMNSDSYGFWLNDGDMVMFPSGFARKWKRSNFNNTLAVTQNAMKSSSSTYAWVLQKISGNVYTLKRADAANTMTLTIRLDNYNNIVISGDSGNGENNWNGTWREEYE